MSLASTRSCGHITVQLLEFARCSRTMAVLLDIAGRVGRVASRSTTRPPSPRRRAPPLSEIDLIRDRAQPLLRERQAASACRADLPILEGQDLLDAAQQLVGQRVAYIPARTAHRRGRRHPLSCAGRLPLRPPCHCSSAPAHAARLASVYGPGLRPMDFDAVAEAYVEAAGCCRCSLLSRPAARWRESRLDATPWTRRSDRNRCAATPRHPRCHGRRRG